MSDHKEETKMKHVFFKRVMAMAAALMMLMSFMACSKGSDGGSQAAKDADTIKVGMLGPFTGDNAVYGLAVRNGVELYMNQYNEKGGVNGKKIQMFFYDQKGDSTEAITVFSRMVEQDGITALIGDVLTGNTIAVAGEAYPIHMPMITASATAEAVTYDAATDTVYDNVFRTCFTDPFQGEKMASFAYEKLGAKTAAAIYKNGDDYSVGLKDAFVKKCQELGIEVVDQEGYAAGDMDFKAQLTNIHAKNPDVIFCPNYYEDDGLIVSQAREIGLTATFLGGDGWAGVKNYASAENLEGSYYCSAYASGTPEVAAFEEAYIAAYGKDSLNMFAALGYDAAMCMARALEEAEKTGEVPGSEAYKQAVIDGIRNSCGDLAGITSPSGYSFDEHNNPIKDAVIMHLENGEEVFGQNY